MKKKSCTFSFKIYRNKSIRGIWIEWHWLHWSFCQFFKISSITGKHICWKTEYSGENVHTYSDFFFLFEKFDVFFGIELFNGEMLIKYCAILFMSVSISVSGETKICLSFPICNDHHNESMRNRMVRKDQISNFENQWSFSAAISHNGFK